MALRSYVLLWLLIVSLGACGPDSTSGEPQPEAPADPLRVPFPGPTLGPKTWLPPGEGEDLRLLIGGHLYGWPAPNHPRPARTLSEALPALRERGAHLFVSLGDVVYRSLPEDFAQIHRFADALGLPLVNAVGNHDLAPDPDYWTTNIGPTWFRFDHGPFCGLVGDTQTDTGRFDPEQLAFLKSNLESLGPECRVVALFVHLPIFADRLTTTPLALAGNSPQTQRLLALKFPGGPPFTKDLRPTLEACARKRRVILFCGDVGAHDRFWGLFHHREADSGLELIGSGLGDTDRDALLEMRVSPAGDVAFEIIPLGENAPRKLEERSAGAWTRRFFPQGVPAEVEGYLNRSR